MNYPKTIRAITSSPPKKQIKQIQPFPDYKVQLKFDHGTTLFNFNKIKERFQKIEQEFDKIDYDKSGQLQRDEINKYLQNKLGNKYDKQIIQEIFEELNSNQDDIITKDEFCHGYISNEMNLKSQITELEKSIYFEQQQIKQLQQQNEKVQQHVLDGVGQVQIQILSGEIHSNLPAKQKVQGQVTVQIGYDGVFGRVMQETQPSLSLENPIWKESMYLFIKDGSDLDMEIGVFCGSMIYKTQMKRILRSGLQSEEVIHMNGLGSINLTIEYNQNFKEWSIKKQESIQNEINQMLDQGAHQKLKFYYYQILFGTDALEKKSDTLLIDANRKIRLSNMKQPEEKSESLVQQSIISGISIPQKQKTQIQEIKQEQPIQQTELENKYLKHRNILCGILLVYTLFSCFFRADFLSCLALMFIISTLGIPLLKSQKQIVFGLFSMSILHDLGWFMMNKSQIEQQYGYQSNDFMIVYEIFGIIIKLVFMYLI